MPRPVVCRHHESRYANPGGPYGAARGDPYCACVGVHPQAESERLQVLESELLQGSELLQKSELLQVSEGERLQVSQVAWVG